jgi:transcriptional regulator with XRE-family HTH domain
VSDIFRDYSFGGWLKSFRLKRDLTLRKAAVACKLDPGNYSKLERSELDPPRSKKKIDAIARKLKLDAVEHQLLISTAFAFHLGRLKNEFNEVLS